MFSLQPNETEVSQVTFRSYNLRGVSPWFYERRFRIPYTVFFAVLANVKKIKSEHIIYSNNVMTSYIEAVTTQQESVCGV